MDRPHRVEIPETIALHQHICELVKRSFRRAIPFSQWMELALYHPKWGYYMRPRKKLGREGDFYTNAHIGEIWGRMIAKKILSNHTFPLTIVEVGAGDGRFAKSLLQELAVSGITNEMIEFCIVEISSYHVALQRKILREVPYIITWYDRLQDVPNQNPVFLYANELLDAFPVRIVRNQNYTLKEIYVTEQNGKLIEKSMPLGKESKEFLEEFEIEIPEGQQWEIPLAAIDWWKQLWKWFPTGGILLIDYGTTLQELTSGRYPDGTLRAYQNHQIFSVDLDRPGEMDITYQVPWDLFIHVAKEHAVQEIRCESQASYLLHGGIEQFLQTSGNDPFSPEARQNRRIQHLFYTLGESFQVLSIQK